MLLPLLDLLSRVDVGGDDNRHERVDFEIVSRTSEWELRGEGTRREEKSAWTRRRKGEAREETNF